MVKKTSRLKGETRAAWREKRGKSDDDYPWCRPEREWRAVSEVVVYLGGPRRERMRGSKQLGLKSHLRALQKFEAPRAN